MDNQHRYPISSNGRHVVNPEGQPQARQRRPAPNPTRPAPGPPVITTSSTTAPSTSGAPQSFLDPAASDPERRRSIVDPDCNFEKFLCQSGDQSRDLLSSPSEDNPVARATSIKPVIPPPSIRPQHVYAPMPALGALSLGVRRRKSATEDNDFSRLMNGKLSAEPFLNLFILIKNLCLVFSGFFLISPSRLRPSGHQTSELQGQEATKSCSFKRPREKNTKELIASN